MRDPDFDLADCLARVRMEDQDAARSLVEYLYPVVIRIVRRNLPRRASEEDLVQEIFLKVFDRLHQYRGQVPLYHWVSRIAANHSLNAIRFERARPEWRMADLSKEQEAALEGKSMAVPPSQPGHAMDCRELVEKILQTLGPEDRLLIQKLSIEEFSIAEVRKTTGWSSGYVRLRVCRARKKLNGRFARLKQEALLVFGPALCHEPSH
jgi:RNA polymerase sigma-70 factor (ECF subfamily)